jgi:hypothetical protein
MKMDQLKAIKDLTDFLEHPLTDEKMKILAEHLHIDNFRKISKEVFPRDDKMVKKFRKGQIGDWKNYFTDDDQKLKLWNQKIDDLVENTK